MPADSRGVLLAQRTFELKDQVSFAQASGDFNPIHTDPVEARRRRFGECIVHGVHGLLWGLDSLLSDKSVDWTTLTCSFVSPIFLSRKISLWWDESNLILRLCEDELIRTEIRLETHHRAIAMQPLGLERRGPSSSLTVPLNLTDAEIIASRPNYDFRGSTRIAERMFPSLFDVYGADPVLVFLITTEIIGMQVPGLNSLFTKLVLKLKDGTDVKKSDITLSYDTRFNYLQVSLSLGNMKLHLEALRLNAARQMMSLDQIARATIPSEFHQSKALVVGGSRGLGEVVAKILAAGGAHVTITYNKGVDEASRLYEEFSRSGLSVDIKQLDVLQPNTMSLDHDYTSIYYFASPRILNESIVSDLTQLTQDYSLFYRNAFMSLIRNVKSPGRHLRVFYPSTVFIDSPSPHFNCYAEQKLKGEELCHKLNQEPELHVTAVRLPALPTDQTEGLPEDQLRDPLETLLPCVRTTEYAKNF